MVANINDFIEDILPHIEAKSRNSWIQRVKCFKEKYPLPSYENILHPANIIPFVGSKVPSDTIITTDVGQHQMWVAQRYPFKYPKALLTSSGLGTMGFGLPVAIRAALASSDKTMVVWWR